jgi:mRNA-degrading endonuclease RelE of RelBE toxin-antitoxin system
MIVFFSKEFEKSFDKLKDNSIKIRLQKVITTLETVNSLNDVSNVNRPNKKQVNDRIGKRNNGRFCQCKRAVGNASTRCNKTDKQNCIMAI